MSIKNFYSDVCSASKSQNVIVNIKWFICNHTLHMLFLIRLGGSLSKTPLIGRVFSLIIEYIIRILFSSDISLKAKFGKGLVIAHGHDIVIGADVILGDNCKIFNGVTLGNRDTEKSSKGNQPRVGHNVLISTGAKILGPVIIGNNVKIGANSVVLKNCTENGTYVGVPATRLLK
jgi:serine O-acetyltransferase